MEQNDEKMELGAEYEEWLDELNEDAYNEGQYYEEDYNDQMDSWEDWYYARD